MPKISVIMLTYNRENLVSRAIESILNQTENDFEFVIIDNGSSDNSGKIADEYAKNDSRIKVIHREKGNIGSGRNTGLDAVNGEYVTFIDDDDWAESDFLEFLYIQISLYNICLGNIYIFFNSSGNSFPCSNKYSLKSFLPYSPFGIISSSLYAHLILLSKSEISSFNSYS